MSQPLAGIRVLDFSTLLPGPMATLLLAEAGAEVIKIERPGTGEEMRHYPPRWGADSVNFAMLNRGKTSLALDLKDEAAVGRVLDLARSADVVVEQFRPGVMDRLGLGWEAMRAVNPRLVYCSITGYGQTGPKAMRAGHDLNYIGDTGLLALASGRPGARTVPPALIADIAGGTYPAVINILLALRRRDASGEGCRLDIAMTDHLFTFMYWALGEGQVTGEWPGDGEGLVAGGSPRYQLYETRDGRIVAAAPLEERFWQAFCAAIGLEPALREDARDPAATRAGVARLIAARTADEWASVLAAADCCVTVVADLATAFRDPHFRARGLFAHRVRNDEGSEIAALPVAVAPEFRAARDSVAASPPLVPPKQP